MGRPRVRILIIGSGGQIGGALYDTLKKQRGWKIFCVDKFVGVPGTPRGTRYPYELDITYKNAVQKCISRIKPHVVILCAAMTNVDACEGQKKIAKRINVDGVKYVAEACKAHSAKLIFFSSAYVFDGRRGNYREDDVPHPVSYYGKTKLQAEQCIQKTLRDYIIIRTTWVFDRGFDGKNFLAQLVNNLGAGKSMKVPRDQYGNPTLARNISAIVREMIKRNSQGIWHVAGRDRMNKYDWVVRMAKHFGLDVGLILPVSTRTLHQQAKRPLKGDLDTGKAQKAFYTKLLSLSEALKKILLPI